MRLTWSERKSKAPAAERCEFSEATDAMHCELKARLSTALKGLPNVRAAYLARVAGKTELAICVRTEIGYDECVVRAAGNVTSVAPGTVRVRFIDESQERELRRVCAPFYAGMP